MATTTIEDYRRFRRMAERCYVNPRRRGEMFGLLLGSLGGFFAGLVVIL